MVFSITIAVYTVPRVPLNESRTRILGRRLPFTVQFRRNSRRIGVIEPRIDRF